MATPIVDTSVPSFLENSVRYYGGLKPDANWRALMARAEQSDRPTGVGQLRSRLRGPVNLKPELVNVTGTFFPAALLSSGWWERQKRRARRKLQTPKEPLGLRHWLLRGFEEWGPSWDFNEQRLENKLAPLFGQIADGDEVNSLPIVIQSEKADSLRRNDLPEHVPFPVQVRGVLCHRDSNYFQTHGKNHRAELDYFGKQFQYVLLVEDGVHRHSINRLSDVSDPYTGYLWQCWAPASLLANGTAPSLQQVYFVWEHTDMSNPDALRFNLDSLAHKHDYLSKTLAADLTLLFKSSAVVPGRAELSHADFYAAIATGFTSGD